ncbi:MAG: glycosyltransferase [Elusimicrobiota bacterium]
MKVALVHDWLTGMRGGEKVLEALGELFPQADIFTLLWIKGKVSEKIEQHPIYTSFLQKIPGAGKNYRNFLPIMPLAIERFNLQEYDLVISSSHCVAKGVKKLGRKSIHICYCHTPMRYIWNQYEEYFNPERTNFIVRSLMGLIRVYLQRWDVKSSERVNYFIANSHNVKKRIKDYYRREAEVIYPPVDIDGYPAARLESYYLMVTALVPYKRVDIAIKTFNELGCNLKIIGSGPDEKRLKNLAAENIEFLGWKTNAEIKSYYAGCRALIFPQEEDFGITAVEVQAAGKPVVAYGYGGALETVNEGRTGVFFFEPAAASLKEAVRKIETVKFSPEDLKKNAEKFSYPRFYEEIRKFVDKVASKDRGISM